MLKVIIADDEERVCRLIVKLVDWNALDMEVADTAHNGIEALELVRKHQPDIIITDIRMPGYDGLEMIEKAKKLKDNLEFIIISGYGQFEYAQKAIKFGVSDYLLKPIQKTELTNTLQKLGAQIRNSKGQLNSSLLDEMRIRSDQEKRRIHFMQILLSGEELEVHGGSHEFCKKYGLTTLTEGYSQLLVLKTDTKSSTNSEDKEVIETDIRNELDKVFSGHLLVEKEVYQEDQMILIFLHFSHEHREEIMKLENTLLNGFKKQIHLLQNRTLTIGQGHIVDGISFLSHSYETAMLALEELYVKGTGKMYYRENLESGQFIRKDMVHEFFGVFEKHLSILDLEGVKRLLREMTERINEDEKITGHEVLHLAKEICNLYSFTMLKNKFSLAESSKLMDKFEMSIRNAQSSDEIFQALEGKILNSMAEVIKNKKEMLSSPIREAKRYMEENYMSNLTLDEVSQKVGFSSSYFSSLFKKETGISFIDHLSEIRVNSARELLKDKDLRIVDICEMVGYSDVKYFTRSFIKRTGLKPNEYRKIYS